VRREKTHMGGGEGWEGNWRSSGRLPAKEGGSPSLTNKRTEGSKKCSE